MFYVDNAAYLRAMLFRIELQILLIQLNEVTRAANKLARAN